MTPHKTDDALDTELDTLAIHLQLNELQTRWMKSTINEHYLSREAVREAIGELPKSFKKCEVGYSEYREAFLAGWAYSQDQIKQALGLEDTQE